MLRDVNQMGRDTCQTTIIFLYLHPRLPSLSLCVYLGSRCSRIRSVLPWPLPPSLYSAHSGCIPACCQPSRPVPVAEREKDRQKEGWMESEGKDSRRQRTSGKKKFSLQYEENFWYELKLLETARQEHSLPNCSCRHAKLGQTFKEAHKIKHPIITMKPVNRLEKTNYVTKNIC